MGLRLRSGALRTVPPMLMALSLAAALLGGGLLPCAWGQGGGRGAFDPLKVAPLEESLRMLLRKSGGPGQGAPGERLLRELGRRRGCSSTQTWQVRAAATGHRWDSVTMQEEGVTVGGGGGGGGGDVVNPCAKGTLYPFMKMLGWNFLALSTDPNCSDVEQAFSAGYVEGRLTWQLMWQHFQNEFGALTPSAHLEAYLEQNLAYMEDQVESHAEGKGAQEADADETSFWWQVGLTLVQVKGLESGYRAAAPPEFSLPPFAFQLMSLHGDIYDLQATVARAARLRGKSEGRGSRSEGGSGRGRGSEDGSGSGSEDRSGSGSEDRSGSGRVLAKPQDGKAAQSGGSISAAQFRRSMMAMSSSSSSSGGSSGVPPAFQEACSSIVKVLPGNADLVTSQATWTRLETMLRVFKAYSLAYRRSANSSEGVSGKNMVFSSYPGRLFSGDDYYLISSGLTVQETTIGNDNRDLEKYITPEGTVLEWIRNMVANRLASTGEQWVSFFRRHNSGTYNNQWMVVDNKRFAPGAPPGPGTLWVLEQLPGVIEAADVTEVLVKETYWASYNIPYFPSIFNLSGFARLEEKFGDFFSHARNARARLFRRDQASVVDLPSLQRLMRYNDYQHDPLSRCDCDPPFSAELAIAARGDLNSPNGSYSLPFLGLRDHAETDTKISSFKMLEGGTLNCLAISGPTWDQQPPFRWSTSPFANVTHLGHPDLFLFPWLSISLSS